MIAPDESPSTIASILLVDDLPANLLALSAVLKPLGARIVEARSGQEAIDRIAREPFAVVLLDVQMPDMDGFDTASRIRAMEAGRELPIIFLTAIHRDDGFVKKGYTVGAADYITKPFDAEIVRARVRAFVHLFEQREEVRRAQVALRTQERDEAIRRLVAFERIATAALQTSDLSSFLKELLEVFMSAADDADSATILLREKDNRLRVHACLGLNEEVDERYSVDMGESFAGAIARQRQPLEVSNASSSPFVRSEWIRARGTQGLYGVPLLHDEAVLGVAHIGSIRATGFSDAEKRLFGAMAERASWGVAEHLKRARIQEVQAERARLLELERKARLHAEVANRMKDEFLATVSHELRTPLNAILGWTVIARTKEPSPEIDRALAIVERNARAQARMLEDVLDLSRVVTGKLRLDMTSVLMNDVVQSALDAVRPSAQAKNVEIRVTIPADLGLRADAYRLQQVVWNLISNAIKFTPKDGRVEVHAELRRDQTSGDECVSFRVTDNGEGIEPGFLGHVFEPFRQADASTTRRHGGLGLGLAIVKQIVDAHGGTIDASSNGKGQGASFVVELPVQGQPPSSREQLVSSPPSSPSPSPVVQLSAAKGPIRLDRLKVLVVDDDADTRMLLVHVLAERGASVVEASSARGAFSEIERWRPDVLVSDIAMPGGDGYGLIRAVRALLPDAGGRTPAIAVTAHARSADGERAYAAGFQAHLSKPVDLGRFVSMVANLGGLSFDRLSNT